MKQNIIYPEYSLVFFPPTQYIEQINLWKLALKAKIGTFTSSESQAHITIAEFLNEDELNRFIHLVKGFSSLTIPIEAEFGNLVFGSTNFLIEPSTLSKKNINQLIRDLHNYIQKKGIKPSAHISIARNLSNEEMHMAIQMFKEISVNYQFTCDTFYLRKYNSKAANYWEIIEKIQLSGKHQPDLFSF